MNLKQEKKIIFVCIVFITVLIVANNKVYSQDKTTQEPFRLNANVDVTAAPTQWRLISKPETPGNYENYYKRPLKHYDLINKNNSGVVNLPETPSFAAQAKKDAAGVTFKQHNPVNSCNSCTPVSLNYYYEYAQFNNFMPSPSIIINKSGFGMGVNCPGF